MNKVTKCKWEGIKAEGHETEWKFIPCVGFEPKVSDNENVLCIYCYAKINKPDIEPEVIIKKLYSMNEDVYFKIDESGHKIINKNAEEFHRENPQIDITYRWKPYKDKWYRKQLWTLFSEFGGESFVGSMLPVYDLTFEDPTL